MKVTKDDFDKAKEKVLYLKKGDIPEGLYIWSCISININKWKKYYINYVFSYELPNFFF
jgi:hypothetical protein